MHNNIGPERHKGKGLLKTVTFFIKHIWAVVFECLIRRQCFSCWLFKTKGAKYIMAVFQVQNKLWGLKIIHQDDLLWELFETEENCFLYLPRKHFTKNGFKNKMVKLNLPFSYLILVRSFQLTHTNYMNYKL